MSEAKKKTSFGGAVVPHHKNTAELETITMPSPEVVKISMSQHIGAPCSPVVSVGDTVKVGQIIGNTDAFLAVPIHASVSGTVKEIVEEKNHQNKNVTYVVIASDGKGELSAELKPFPIEKPEDLIEAAKKAGLVGLGGAGFPTFVKLSPQNREEIDSIIINGAECEPYLTCDYREMMEKTEDIVGGIRLVSSLFPKAHIYFGIESNKPAAIKKLSEAFETDTNISVVTLRARYPQGAEKVIIYECVGRMQPEGGLPANVGVIVLNTTTVASLHRFVETGRPLTHRRITVDGNGVKKGANVMVPVGTKLSDIIEFVGGYTDDAAKMIMGGPMMGVAVENDGHVTEKATNGIVVMNQADNTHSDMQTNCMNCGSCIDACPIHLLPTDFEKAVDKGDVERLRLINVKLCMECGTCSYVCPAKRDLVAKIRKGKAMLMEKK